MHGRRHRVFRHDLVQIGSNGPRRHRTWPGGRSLHFHPFTPFLVQVGCGRSESGVEEAPSDEEVHFELDTGVVRLLHILQQQRELPDLREVETLSTWTKKENLPPARAREDLQTALSRQNSHIRNGKIGDKMPRTNRRIGQSRQA